MPADDIMLTRSEALDVLAALYDAGAVIAETTTMLSLVLAIEDAVAVLQDRLWPEEA